MLGQKEIHETPWTARRAGSSCTAARHRSSTVTSTFERAPAPERRAGLIDFGGVRAAWQPPGAAGATVVGTFGYMAPEQFAGRAGPASDLYSLGATLLHLVTGHPPSDFPFDAGRIEIPDDLPTDRPLAGLIEALLRPAPRATGYRPVCPRPADEPAGQKARQMTAPHARPPARRSRHRENPRRSERRTPLRPHGGSSTRSARRAQGRLQEPDAPLFPARRAWSDWTSHLDRIRRPPPS